MSAVLTFGPGDLGNLLALVVGPKGAGNPLALVVGPKAAGEISAFCLGAAIFLAPPRGSSAAGAGPSWVGGTRAMPSGEIWGGNGPAAGALIGLTPPAPPAARRQAHAHAHAHDGHAKNKN
jgi:hypothetical protein